VTRSKRDPQAWGTNAPICAERVRLLASDDPGGPRKCPNFGLFRIAFRGALARTSTTGDPATELVTVSCGAGPAPAAGADGPRRTTRRSHRSV